MNPASYRTAPPRFACPYFMNSWCLVQIKRRSWLVTWASAAPDDEGHGGDDESAAHEHHRGELFAQDRAAEDDRDDRVHVSVRGDGGGGEAADGDAVGGQGQDRAGADQIGQGQPGTQRDLAQAEPAELAGGRGQGQDDRPADPPPPAAGRGQEPAAGGAFSAGRTGSCRPPSRRWQTG